MVLNRLTTERKRQWSFYASSTDPSRLDCTAGRSCRLYDPLLPSSWCLHPTALWLGLSSAPCKPTTPRPLIALLWNVEKYHNKPLSVKMNCLPICWERVAGCAVWWQHVTWQELATNHLIVWLSIVWVRHPWRCHVDRLRLQYFKRRWCTANIQYRSVPVIPIWHDFDKKNVKIKT